MKLNKVMRFPHPVLSGDSGDYKSGAFQTQFAVVEKPDIGEVRLEYSIELDEPTLIQLVRDGRASVGIFVTCRDTYYTSLVPLGLKGGQVSFEPGKLMGLVSVHPLIWTREGVGTFPLTNCHEEFGNEPIEFKTGTVLAIDDEIRIDVGREKLAQMETIFDIAESADLTGGTLSVDLDADRITVLVASDIYETVNTLRNLGHGRPITLNCVFLPAVMQVIDVLREGTSAYEGRRWYRVFEAKCTHLGIDPASCDLWEAAQKLLKAPFLDIHHNKEILGR